MYICVNILCYLWMLFLLLTQEAKEVNILDAKIFSSNQGTGIAVMTTSFRVFLITDYQFQRIFRLADIPGKGPSTCRS